MGSAESSSASLSHCSIFSTGAWRVVRYEIRFGDRFLAIGCITFGDHSQELAAKATLIAQFLA
ncbi:hypothetical protein H6F96_07155 [Microcoleus sp. FACHB-53]|nr:hypothetical protein [Microcoleus sp. FACHB-53]